MEQVEVGAERKKGGEGGEEVEGAGSRTQRLGEEGTDSEGRSCLRPVDSQDRQ